jgi:hypothetical protein
MRKQDYSNCCMWLSVLGLVIVGIIVVVGGGSFYLAIETNRIAPSTPTPITSCEGLLQNIHSTPVINKNILVDKKYLLDVYQVQGDQIFGPQKGSAPENLQTLQDDLESHILIWDYFIHIIPSEQRSPLTEFRIFSDGSGNKAGLSEIKRSLTNNSESETWALEVDLADYQDLKSINDTLVHEFGHMLTLNIHQIDIKADPVKCQVFTDDNQCSFKDSYLNRFFTQFWKKDLYEEWQTIMAQSDKSAVRSGLASFYEAHPKDFVRDYAATSPREDIADSWTYFVLTTKPAGDTVAEQKILFFYGFPELVNLRSEIRGRICQYYNMPQ